MCWAFFLDVNDCIILSVGFVFVEKKKEIETYENETRENNDMRQEDKKQSIKPEKKSVFAKLKKYNNNSRQVNANMTPTNNKKQTTNMNDNVVYETNKFSREGLLSSFMMLEQPTRKLKENATLTFKDFKMMKKKKLSII